MGSIFRIPLGLSITIDKDYTAVIGQRAYERIELGEADVLVLGIVRTSAVYHAGRMAGSSARPSASAALRILRSKVASGRSSERASQR